LYIVWGVHGREAPEDQPESDHDYGDHEGDHEDEEWPEAESRPEWEEWQDWPQEVKKEDEGEPEEDEGEPEEEDWDLFQGEPEDDLPPASYHPGEEPQEIVWAPGQVWGLRVDNRKCAHPLCFLRVHPEVLIDVDGNIFSDPQYDEAFCCIACAKRAIVYPDKKAKCHGLKCLRLPFYAR